MASRGNPHPPVITSRGARLGGSLESSISDILDATFGATPNMCLIRGVNGWAVSPTASLGGILTFTWGLGVTIGGNPTPVAVGTNPANIYLPCTENGTFNRVFMIAVTGPVGAALIVDILKSTNFGSSFTTIFSAKPQISDGSLSGGQAAVFSTPTINSGDLLRLDISQVGSGTPGNNVTVVLEVIT